MAGNAGPTVDGTGMKTPKEVMPKDTQDVSVSKSVPGGESKSGSQIHMTGPGKK
jgi:hypothetical protein